MDPKEVDAAEKQKADVEKKRADAVLFEISDAVCRCRFHSSCGGRGLFRVMLGSSVSVKNDVWIDSDFDQRHTRAKHMLSHSGPDCINRPQA